MVSTQRSPFSVLSDRENLRNQDEIKKLNQAVLQTLQRELTHHPPLVIVKGDVSVLSKLLNKRHTLRQVENNSSAAIFPVSSRVHSNFFA